MTIREATHASSWYTGSPRALDHELEGFLSAVDADKRNISGCRVIIAPHAGYAYSGPTAAWAYAALDTSKTKRVFILGPSHHTYLEGCALSKCSAYATPLGELPIDTKTNKELQATGKFTTMSIDVDEDEHSIEMHLPYVRKIFKDISIVPILVGAISSEKEQEYGEVLAPYLQAQENTFVVSSDFAHWGTRFRYTFYQEPAKAPVNLSSRSTASMPPATYPIYKSIEAVDRRGMELIAKGAHAEYTRYLRETRNTICGRHPIGVIMCAIAAAREPQRADSIFAWHYYAQSSRVTDARDSSVSYASGISTAV